MDSFLRNEYVLTLMGMGLFQLWAYRAKKSIRVKLLPPMIAIILCLVLMVSNAAIIWVILLIPIMEASLWSLLAACAHRNRDNDSSETACQIIHVDWDGLCPDHDYFYRKENDVMTINYGI